MGTHPIFESDFDCLTDMWYLGDVGSAVELVQKEAKILMVFGCGSDEQSTALAKLFEKRSQFLEKALTNKCVCLKLDEGSEPFKQFSEFWPILTTPIVYFINGGGAKIAEPLVGDVTEKDILQAIHPVTHNTLQQPSTSNLSPAMENSSAPESLSVETEAEKQARNAAKSEEYRAKIEDARAKKVNDFKESERKKEMERRELGKTLVDQKREREEKEMIETAKEKRKDKKSDAEHLKKLREQIAQDRANRKKDYETVSAEEKAQNDEKRRKIAGRARKTRGTTKNARHHGQNTVPLFGWVN